ncbi:MAG: hypothetical protein AAFY97_04910 [Pseudomonadota bacterium]
MIPRWLYFAPLLVLALIVGYTGLKLRIERDAVTEQAVIEYYAKRYLEDHAELIGPEAAITDCVGVPGEQGRIWVEVRCTPPGGEAAFLYGANRGGGLEYAARAAEVPEV